MEAMLIKTGENFILKDVDGETLAITSGSTPGRMLSLKNCKAIEDGYDLDELAASFIGVPTMYYDENDTRVWNAVGYGFRKALEILDGKLFTIPQVINLCTNYYRIGAAETGMPYDKRTVLPKEIIEDLKSLQQTEWEVEILEIEDGEVYSVSDNMKVSHDKTFDGVLFKYDADQCLILKRK